MSHNNQERNRYGVCRNDACSKSKDKEPQVIPTRKEFVCSECGRPLREVPRPKTTWEKYGAIIVVAIALVAIATGGYFIFSCKDKEKVGSSTLTSDNTSVDSSEVIVNDDPSQDIQNEAEDVPTSTMDAPKEESKVVEPSRSAEQPTSGSLKLSYGNYSGAVKGGYPHGQGRLTYTTSRQINRNDIKGRTANAGDYVIGEFYNGFVVYGKHYDSNGNLLESLNFGMGSEDSYESK